MNNNPGVIRLPMLRPRHMVTLSLKHKKIQATFDRNVMGDLWLRCGASDIASLEFATHVHLSFIHEQYIYSGLARVLSMNPREERVVVSEPMRLRTRPLRKHVRVKLQLPSAVILRSSPDSEPHYVPRDQGCLFDIAEGGALLGCNTPLPVKPHGIMLLFSLDASDPYNEGLQIYVPGTVVREARETTEPEFPHYFGIKFSAIVPTFRVMLQHYIELNGRVPKHYASVDS